VKLLLIIISIITIFSSEYTFSQQRFNSVWHTTPWDSGGIAPNSVVWSLHNEQLDLDNDGKKEFLCVSSWSDTFYNAVYLYENNGNNSFQIVWWYRFYGYSNDYSNVAVSDLDNDGKKEILCLVDPLDSTYHGLYVFEWDGTDNGFPTLPTTTWNFNLRFAFDEGGAIIAGDFDNDNREEIAVLFQESYTYLKTRLMIFSLDSNSTFANPVWNIEMNDTTTFYYSGYALAATDLDRDGKKEIIASGWDSTFHLAIFENTGVANTYTRAANIWNMTSYADFSNGGFVEANFDNDATNELYISTAAGNIFIVTNNGNVHAITNANVFSFASFLDGKGLIGIAKGNADGNSFENLYVAGSYHENILDFEYRGGDVKNISSYVKTIAIQDDTTDDHTPNSDQGYLRPSKIVTGDFDSDGIGDMIISSSSFASDKPMLTFAEFNGENSVQENFSPKTIPLFQNYPNPFNPKTVIRYQLIVNSVVTLNVFDIAGKEVATLLHNKEIERGIHEIEFDANNLPSGMYFAKLSVGKFSQTKKMIFLK
jgi:hypothetical protein